jgi:hypothetical protein
MPRGLDLHSQLEAASNPAFECITAYYNSPVTLQVSIVRRHR